MEGIRTKVVSGVVWVNTLNVLYTHVVCTDGLWMMTHLDPLYHTVSTPKG